MDSGFLIPNTQILVKTTIVNTLIQEVLATDFKIMVNVMVVV